MVHAITCQVSHRRPDPHLPSHCVRKLNEYIKAFWRCCDRVLLCSLNPRLNILDVTKCSERERDGARGKEWERERERKEGRRAREVGRRKAWVSTEGRARKWSALLNRGMENGDFLHAAFFVLTSTRGYVDVQHWVEYKPEWKGHRSLCTEPVTARHGTLLRLQLRNYIWGPWPGWGWFLHRTESLKLNLRDSKVHWKYSMLPLESLHAVNKGFVCTLYASIRRDAQAHNSPEGALHSS